MLPEKRQWIPLRSLSFRCARMDGCQNRNADEGCRRNDDDISISSGACLAVDRPSGLSEQPCIMKSEDHRIDLLDGNILTIIDAMTSNDPHTLDAQDPLKWARDEFEIPLKSDSGGDGMSELLS